MVKLSLETPRKTPRPRFRRATRRQLDWPMLAHGRRTHCTVLIPTTTSSGWITKSGTASFARKSLRQRNTRSDEVFLRTLEEQPGMGRSGASPARADRARRPAAPAEHADPRRLVRLVRDHVRRPTRLLREATRDQCALSHCRSSTSPITMPIGRSASITWGTRSRGLVSYSQVLDGFFHDATPPSVRPARTGAPGEQRDPAWSPFQPAP